MQSDGAFRADVQLDERTALLSGELDMAYTESLTMALTPLVERPGDVIMDLGQLSFIDSSGLLALLRTADRIRDGRLVLRNPSDPVRRVPSSPHVSGRTSPIGRSPTSTPKVADGCRSTMRRTSVTRSRGSGASRSRMTPRETARGSGC
jgi:anti-anti-sigma factor